MEPAKFTQTALAAVPAPKDDRTIIKDPKVSGLCFVVTAGNARSFYWIRRVPGRNAARKHQLGPFDELTVEQARNLAGNLNSRLAARVDPIAELDAARQAAETAAKQNEQAPTLATLWQDFQKNHSQIKNKPKTQEDYEGMYERHLKAHADVKLADWDGNRVEAIKLEIGHNHGHYAANRVLALLSAMFRKRGRFFGLPAHHSPTIGIERFKEEARDRILQEDEMPRFLAALDKEDNRTARDFFKLCLFTGARRNNVLTMKWEDISEQRKTWTIPGQTMKNGRPLTVPILPEAWSILEARQKLVPTDSPYVFPADKVTPAQVEQARTLKIQGKATRQIAHEVGISQTQALRILKPNYMADAPAAFSEPRKAWLRILKAAKIATNTRIHDLRRTFVSYQFLAGASMPMVQASVGHKNAATTMKSYAVAMEKQIRTSVAGGISAMMDTKTNGSIKAQDKGAA